MKCQVLGSHLFGSGDSRSELPASLGRRFRRELLASVFLKEELVEKLCLPCISHGHTMRGVEREWLWSHWACIWLKFIATQKKVASVFEP